MSRSDDVFRTGNPFPSTPAAQLRVLPREGRTGSMTLGPPTTVGTRAGATLRSQVTEYLERAEEPATRGRALALIGGFGMGKSHLAAETITEILESGAGMPLWIISQPSRDMAGLYREQLTATYENGEARAAFERVVEAFHAHVTAAALEEDHHGLDDRSRREFVELLRNDELDSQKVALTFGMDQERIHRHLRAELREVTGHRQFATALALLLDTRFKPDVWDWLTGAAPAPALQQRGITTSIDSTRWVLEAFTVFGFLHGQVGRPYGLVLDALEVVLDWRDDEAKDFLNGFEALVNTYVNRGGLVLMCTQPDKWSELTPGLHERVLQIWPDRLGRDGTAELVDAYVRHRRPGGGTAGASGAPFTPDAVDQLVALGDGVPRQILKTCRRAWEVMERPGEARSAIDAAVVHEAVRELHEQRALTDVYDVVERVLAARQFPHESQPQELRAAAGVLGHVRYWVRVGERDVVAILVVRSVLVEREVLEIDAVSRAARAAFDGGCRTLVLVNGTVARAVRERIAQYTGTSPILVGEGSFEARLGDAVELLTQRLVDARQGERIARVWDRLAEMSAQQTTVLESVRQLDARLPATAAVRADSADDRADDLPGGVTALFTEVQDTLDELFQGLADPGRVFAVDDSGRPVAGLRPRRLTFDRNQLRALGLLSAVDGLLRAFRDSVTAWWRAAARTAPEGPDAGLRDGLSALCRSFEISMEVLPVPEVAGPTTRTAVAVHLARARNLLGSLAESVHDGLLGAADPSVTERREPPTPR